MAGSSPSQFTSRQLQARACSWVGICLIGLFLVELLGFLPPKLLDPDWQLLLAGKLTDIGAFPLLGLLLVSLASILDPNDPSINKRQLQWRSLACWVSVAYLLLIPLIGLACKSGLDRASLSLQRETRNAQQGIIRLRSAIQTANSLAELQLRFRQLQAPPLPADAGSIPLADLKSGLLDRLQANQNILVGNLRQPLFIRFLPILQKALLNILGCLVLAVGYAAVAVPNGAPRSQLQICAAALSGFNTQWEKWMEKWRNWRASEEERRESANRMAYIRRAQRESQRQSRRLAARNKSKNKKAWANLFKRGRKSKNSPHD